MSDSNISDFMNITGCTDHSRAKFYIESSNGDLDAAVISYFENGDDERQSSEPAASSSSTAPAQNEGRLGEVRMTDKKDKKGSNEYYAGGAQSGLGIMAPRNDDSEANDDFVKDVFKRAKESVGAKAHEERAERRKEERFIGTGYRLGGDGVQSQAIPGQQARQQPKDMRICMWKSGFTLDDGPLRRYDDPANKEFLDQITRGELPTELRALGTEINVSMEDRRQDSYEENKPKEVFKSFGGSGNRLGADSGSTSSVSAPPTAEMTTPTVDVDSSKPVTKLRIRLASGKQVVQEFNQSHTVQDLKSFCSAAAGGKSFELRAGFPPKPLDLSSSQSLMDAKLLNETIIQRFL